MIEQPAVTTTTPTTPNATETAITEAAAGSKGTMIEQLVAGLRKAGVSEADIAAACADDGVELPKAPTAAGPDLRSETEKEIDAAGLSGAKSADAYEISVYGKDAALVSELKAGFYSLGVSTAAAPGLADLMFEASDRFGNLQPEGKTAARIAAREALENVFGKGAPAEPNQFWIAGGWPSPNSSTGFWRATPFRTRECSASSC